MSATATGEVERGGRSAFADAFRAVAILGVLGSHLARYTWRGAGFLGVWGVNCFFVLSGFLLAGPYLRHTLDRATPRPSSRAS